MMDAPKLKIGEDNICPITNKACDDECCAPGSICNLTPNPSIGSAPINENITD